jgi:hypothetical protein
MQRVGASCLYPAERLQVTTLHGSFSSRKRVGSRVCGDAGISCETHTDHNQSTEPSELLLLLLCYCLHIQQSKRARDRAEAKRRELEEDKRLAKERQKAEEEVAE